MLTRQDFERIAQVFRVYSGARDKERDLWELIIDDMCVELKAINPRFDADRFKAACEKRL